MPQSAPTTQQRASQQGPHFQPQALPAAAVPIESAAKPLCKPASITFAFNLTLCVLFVGGIAAPLLGRLSGLSASSIEETENRRAAPMPELVYKDLGPIRVPRTKSVVEFPAKFEAYYNDHFGFRTPLVRTYNAARMHGLVPQVLGASLERNFSGDSLAEDGGEAPTAVGALSGNSQVLFGREGWLYLNDEANIRNYRNGDPFSAAQLDAWAKALEARRDWLAQRGCAYVMIIPPSKPTIYPQYMPRAINRLSELSRLDQLVERMAKVPGPPVLVDVRRELRKASSQHLTYYRTDTHWNAFGAYVGYRKVMETLAQQQPGIVPLEADAYRIKVSPMDGGDLARMIQGHAGFADIRVDMMPVSPSSAKYVAPPEGLASPYWKHFQNPAAKRETLLVLHDSFAWSMLPFLNEFAQDVWCHSTHGFPSEVIEEKQPQVVIQVMTERFLMTHSPEAPEETIAAK